MLNFTTENLALIAKHIINGGIVALPTDTLYALSCDATNERAVEQIYSIKGRFMDKPLPILCSDLEQVNNFCIINKIAHNLATKFWPGALTLVMKKKLPSILANNISYNSTLGVRIPNHQNLIALITRLKKPIVGTSANLSGQPSIHCKKEIQIVFNKHALIVTEDDRITTQSTIVKVNENDYDILRQGSIAL